MRHSPLLRLSQHTAALLTVALVALPTPAFALQPLGTFIAAANDRNPDAIAAKATIRQRSAEAKGQLSKLLPAFTARGVYTRNQYEAAVTLPGGPSLTITPQNQLDAFFILDVPIIDLAQFARYDSSKLQRVLAEASKDLTERQLSQSVVQAYYTLMGSAALIRSAEMSLDASQKNLDYVKTRVSAGVAPDLDLQRAIANVERAKQDVADAQLSQVLAARSLETLARIRAEPATDFPTDDLHAEAPLADWLRIGKDKIPELRVAEAQVEIADANARAAGRVYIPTLAAQAQERLTNATGFVGHATVYTATATLSWRFDLNTIAQKEAADASADVSRAQAEGTRRNAEDAIVDAWNRVNANTVKAQAARAQRNATNAAAKLAADRYGSGTATQLDVTQAQRDDFQADAARIQADLELAQSRAILRIASGHSVTDPSPSTPTSSERAHP